MREGVYELMSLVRPELGEASLTAANRETATVTAFKGEQWEFGPAARAVMERAGLKPAVKPNPPNNFKP
ncbi:MAG TPA: hypothetical protein VIY48_00740 [Candidatus Paceibacterota bacterium]